MDDNNKKNTEMLNMISLNEEDSPKIDPINNDKDFKTINIICSDNESEDENNKFKPTADLVNIKIDENNKDIIIQPLNNKVNDLLLIIKT